VPGLPARQRLPTPRQALRCDTGVCGVIDFDLLRAEAASHPYPLLFATVSGAHLYGFPSPDSDYDLRGVHILPAQEAVGLLPQRDTIQIEGMRGGIEMDLVTHDVLKFFTMLLKRNGYVLEQLYSPLVVQTNAEHNELKAIAKSCLTRHHAHHYLGFAATQWSLLQKERPPRVKPLLYLYRVLLTGIHLLRTGEVEANLVHLNEHFRLSYLPELIAQKIQRAEQTCVEGFDPEFHASEYDRLVSLLKAEEESCRLLPTEPGCRGALNDLLIRIRLR
jgi:predicted nucleotidyltransferase